ncbi:hypothetical protein ES703_84635 [subsurface metagenome]
MAVTAARPTLKDNTQAVLVGRAQARRTGGGHDPTGDGKQTNGIIFGFALGLIIVRRQYVLDPGTECGELFAAVLLPIQQEAAVTG